MATLTLHVKDSILEKVLWLLGQFDRAEVEVMGEDVEFHAQRKLLHEQMELYRKGELKTYTTEEVEAHMDNVLKEYEN